MNKITELKEKIIVFILMSIMILLWTPMGSAKAAGNSMSDATQIYANNWYYGTIEDDNKRDFYKITLTSSGRLSINASAEMSVYYYLYDENGEQLEYEYSSYSNVTGNSAYEDAWNLTRGTYYLEVRKSTYTGNYSFEMQFTNANESFAEGLGGNNNSMPTAATISTGTKYKGQIAKNDKCDFYKINLSSAGRLSINASAEMSVYYYLYDENGEQLEYEYSSYSNVTGNSAYEDAWDLTRGTYYLEVRKSTYTGNYSFEMQFTSANESFPENNGGSNNNISAANEIKLGKSYKGQIAFNDYKDFYKVKINKAGSYVLDLNSNTSRMHLIIYDANGKEKYNKTISKDDDLGKIKYELEFEIDTSGTYYICFDGLFTGFLSSTVYTGNYTFNISTKLNPVYINTVKNTSSGIKISWGKVQNTTGYIIYCKTGNGSWKKLTTTSSVSSYVDKTAKSGETYSYKVYPIMGSVKGKNGNIRKMTYVAPIKPTDVRSSGKGKLTIKWKTNKKLSGYQIQYSTNKKFSGAKTKKLSKSKSNYTIKKLKRKKNYYVRIRAYKKVSGIAYYSTWSKAMKVKIK